MKTCLIIQPGAFGDIFVCAPIARYFYDQGLEVFWPVRTKFADLMHYFDYVHCPIISERFLHPDWLRSDVLKCLAWQEQHKPNLVINLADRGPHPTAQRPDENFEQCKYRVANVPFNQKYQLEWTRYRDREQRLFDLLGLQKGEEYAVVHNSDSSGRNVETPEINMRVVNVDLIQGYEIPDWFLVFKHASEIYCTESSVHQFVDGCGEELNAKKFLLRRPNTARGTRLTTSFNWDLKYVGEDSIIRG